MNNPAASNGVSIVSSQTADTGLRQFHAASCGEFNPKEIKVVRKRLEELGEFESLLDDHFSEVRIEEVVVC